MTGDTTSRWGVKLPEGAYLYQFIEKKHMESISKMGLSPGDVIPDELWEEFVEDSQGAFADAASEIAWELWLDFSDEKGRDRNFEETWKSILKEKIE